MTVEFSQRHKANVSIAMATYNGAQHLGAQLESILGQSQQPVELVVQDDCSKDDTVKILEAFTATAPFDVKVEVNYENQGVRRTFHRAIERCSGDFVATSDQDDIWKHEKLEKLLQCALKNDCTLVFSNLDIVDDQLRPAGYTQFEALHFSERQRQLFRQGKAFAALLRSNLVNGNAMMFRTSLRDVALPIGDEWLHDDWFGIIAAAVGKVCYVDESLVLYRKHVGQTVGGGAYHATDQLAYIRRNSNLAYFERLHRHFKSLHDRLRSIDLPAGDDMIEMVGERVAHSAARAEMRRRPMARFPLIYREWANRHYADFAFGWKSALQDMIFCR